MGSRREVQDHRRSPTPGASDHMFRKLPLQKSSMFSAIIPDYTAEHLNTKANMSTWQPEGHSDQNRVPGRNSINWQEIEHNTTTLQWWGGIEQHPTVPLQRYIYTYIHTYIHTYLHACMHACMHAYIHTYTHTYTHILVHIVTDGRIVNGPIYIYIYISVHMHIYNVMYIHVNIYICIYSPNKDGTSR